MLSDVVSIDIIYIYFYMPYLITYFNVTEMWQRERERDWEEEREPLMAKDKLAVSCDDFLYYLPTLFGIN